MRRDGAQELRHREPLDPEHLGAGVAQDQAGERAPALRRRQVPGRLQRVTVVGEPGGGALVQAPTTARVLHREPLAQHVGEQVVEAVPAAPVVERDHEEVVALELLEHPLAVGASGQCVGEVRRDPPRDADVEQEGGHLGRLPGQDLLDEVVGDRAQVAGQLAHGQIEVTAALQ